MPFGHCTGSLSPNGWSTKSSVSHINVCMTPHHSICRNISPQNPPCSLHCYSPWRLSISEFGRNTNKKRSGTRSFCSAAPTLWNRLPDKLHQAKDIAPFWRQLNCFQLYRSSHPPPLILVPSSVYLHRAPSACFSSTYHSPLQFSSYLPSQRACEFLHGVRLRSVSGH